MTMQTWEIKNMRLISHHDLDGYGNIGEGISLQQAPGGRRILYMAHEGAPKDFTSVDVTDLANPKLIAQTDLAHPHLLKLSGNCGRYNAGGVPVQRAKFTRNRGWGLRHRES